MNRRIYLASSWRNAHQPSILAELRAAGHDVYDFRNPAPGERGFAWSEIDPDWQSWTVEQYIEALKHPIAQHGHRRDQSAMEWADTCVLLLPSGRSAHIEAGWCQGSGRPTLALALEPCEPELMYRSLHGVYGSVRDLLAALDALPPCEVPTRTYGISEVYDARARLTAHSVLLRQALLEYGVEGPGKMGIELGEPELRGTFDALPFLDDLRTVLLASPPSSPVPPVSAGSAPDLSSSAAGSEGGHGRRCCSECSGDGLLDRPVCPACGGAGFVGVP